MVLQPNKVSSLVEKRYTIQKQLKILDVIRIFQKEKSLEGEQKGFYLFTSDKRQVLKNTSILG